MAGVWLARGGGPEGCEGGKVSAAGGRERTEYRVRRTEELRRQCKGANRPTAGAKVER